MAMKEQGNGRDIPEENPVAARKPLSADCPYRLRTRAAVERGPEARRRCACKSSCVLITWTPISSQLGAGIGEGLCRRRTKPTSKSRTLPARSMCSQASRGLLLGFQPCGVGRTVNRTSKI